MGLSKVDVVRQALQELGDVSAPELAAFIEQRHGVCIEARFIPVLRASLRGQEMLERARQAARAAVQIAEKSSGDGETDGVAEAIPATAPPSGL